MLWVSIYHRKLAYTVPSRRRHVAISAFLPTTDNYPTVHRPKLIHMSLEEQQRIARHKEWEEQEEWAAKDKVLASQYQDVLGRIERPPPCLTGRWHMVDWGFSHHETGPFMHQFPIDYENAQIPFDGDLVQITIELERVWRAWQQGERPDED
jgi:hypothetical protein